MPTPKQYRTNAQRQAAYRARHSDKKAPREDALALLARSLHVVLEEALQQPGCVLPAHLLGARADETLRNLIHFLDVRKEEGNPTDPNPGSSST